MNGPRVSWITVCPNAKEGERPLPGEMCVTDLSMPVFRHRSLTDESSGEVHVLVCIKCSQKVSKSV